MKSVLNRIVLACALAVGGSSSAALNFTWLTQYMASFDTSTDWRREARLTDALLNWRDCLALAPEKRPAHVLRTIFKNDGATYAEADLNLNDNDDITTITRLLSIAQSQAVAESGYESY